MKIFLVMNLIFFWACGLETSKLPKEMPKNLDFYFNANYGMSPAYKKIAIKNSQISFDAKDYVPEKQTFETSKWTAKIENEDVAKLYQIFVENKFDTIKNDARNGITYDAASEGIVISINDKASYQVGYGKNEPMSGGNLKRYETVKKSIFDLVEKYQGAKQDDFSTENQQIFKYEDVSNFWALKNSKSATLTKEEVEIINEVLPTAVDGYNSTHTQSYRKLQNVTKYKRQIVPYLNEKGEKEIWINCFCGNDHQDWKEQIVMVKDGGNCYFNFKLNLTTKKAFEFMVNGTA